MFTLTLHHGGKPRRIGGDFEMSDWYKLVGREAVKVKDALEVDWDQPVVVAYDDLGKDVGRVSTVFLRLDHSWGDGEPTLFETMVFGRGGRKSDDEVLQRYSTWDKAAAGHLRVCVQELLEREVRNAKSLHRKIFRYGR